MTTGYGAQNCFGVCIPSRRFQTWHHDMFKLLPSLLDCPVSSLTSPITAKRRQRVPYSLRLSEVKKHHREIAFDLSGAVNHRCCIYQGSWIFGWVKANNWQLSCKEVGNYVLEYILNMFLQPWEPEMMVPSWFISLGCAEITNQLGIHRVLIWRLDAFSCWLCTTMGSM